MSKQYTFHREDDKFDDILTDPVIKKHISMKIRWKQYLRIALKQEDDKLSSYIVLKYGDELKNNCLVTDRTPVPFKDYQPKEPKWLK
jgi:hypothetical protein